MKLLAPLLICASISATAATWGPYSEPQNIRLIDGDTFEAKVEVYEDVWITRSFRLRGVNTAEKSSKEACERDAAKKATLFVAEVLKQAKAVVLADVAEDKYAGRADATVLVDGKNLAAIIIAAGLGKAYNGGKRQPWCKDGVPL